MSSSQACQCAKSSARRKNSIYYNSCSIRSLVASREFSKFDGSYDSHSLVVSAWKLSDTIMVEKAFIASIKEVKTLRMRRYKDDRGKVP